MSSATAIAFTSEVAQILGISADTVRLWERSGRLNATHTARGVRLFDRDEVVRLAEDFARQRASNAVPQQPHR